MLWGVLVFHCWNVAYAAPEVKPQADGVVLLDFYSDWCGPCHAMKPTVDALAAAGYHVERIDIDQQKLLAAKYGIESIPCFIAIAEGRELERVVGSCSYQRLEAMATRRATTQQSPRPAWRYEHPVGHRAAVVRIYCQENATSRSIGSGTLVRWNGRVLVLTARHVIRDAKNIIVELCTRRTHWAKVVKVDAVWDCAVLELIGEPEGVEPVDVQLGDRAIPNDGERLESCGYGPDGKLACNSGQFLGFKRSEQTPNGPDDWFELSGPARQGDSGGPIFNTDEKLVGVLWGTNGEVVVGVQAGRLHKLLDAAVPKPIEPQSVTEAVILQRNPTPPKSETTPSRPLAPVPSGECCPDRSCLPQGTLVGQESLGQIFGRKPIPTPGSPQVIVRPDPEIGRALGGIDAKVGMLIEQNRPAQTEVKSQDEASPLLAGLCILAAVAAGFVIYFAMQK
jgi:thioredoxin 1